MKLIIYADLSRYTNQQKNDFLKILKNLSISMKKTQVEACTFSNLGWPKQQK